MKLTSLFFSLCLGIICCRLFWHNGSLNTKTFRITYWFCVMLKYCLAFLSTQQWWNFWIKYNWKVIQDACFESNLWWKTLFCVPLSGISMNNCLVFFFNFFFFQHNLEKQSSNKIEVRRNGCIGITG